MLKKNFHGCWLLYCLISLMSLSGEYSKRTVHRCSEMSLGKVFWLSILGSVKLWILYFHAPLILKTFFWWVFLFFWCHSIYKTLKIKLCLIPCSERFSISSIEIFFFSKTKTSLRFEWLQQPFLFSSSLSDFWFVYLGFYIYIYIWELYCENLNSSLLVEERNNFNFFFKSFIKAWTISSFPTW